MESPVAGDVREEAAPSHLREQPAWVGSMLDFARSTFKETVNGQVQKIVGEAADELLVTLPLRVT